MSSFGTNLLFLHGHIHNPELVRRLANRAAASPSSRQSGKRHRTYSLIAVLALLLHGKSRP